MCNLNEIYRRTPKLEREEFKLRKPLGIRRYFFLKIIRLHKFELKILRNQRMSVVKQMTGQAVGKFLWQMTLRISFFCFLKIKFLENFTAAVIVKILWEQSHEKINRCKNYGCQSLICFISQHSAKLINICRLKN